MVLCVSYMYMRVYFKSPCILCCRDTGGGNISNTAPVVDFSKSAAIV